MQSNKVKKPLKLNIRQFYRRKFLNPGGGRDLSDETYKSSKEKWINEASSTLNISVS